MPPQHSFSPNPAVGFYGHQLLKRGTRFMEPDVIRCQEIDGSVVVKDYARYEGTLWAFLAAWLVRRERRFLTLASREGISPAPLSSNHPLLLTMQWVDGRPPQAGDQAVLSQASEHLKRMKDLGVAHNDVHLSNVLIVGANAMLLDWASAIQRTWWLPRTLLEQLHERDEAHVTKMSVRLAGRPLTPAELRSQTPPFWVRGPLALWRRLYRGS